MVKQLRHGTDGPGENIWLSDRKQCQGGTGLDDTFEARTFNGKGLYGKARGWMCS